MCFKKDNTIRRITFRLYAWEMCICLVFYSRFFNFKERQKALQCLPCCIFQNRIFSDCWSLSFTKPLISSCCTGHTKSKSSPQALNLKLTCLGSRIPDFPDPGRPPLYSLLRCLELPMVGDPLYGVRQKYITKIK